MRVILGVHWDGEGFFCGDRVVVAVDGGVEPHGEDVLVVLGEGAGGDDVAVGRGFALVDVDYRDDTGGAGLDCDAAWCVSWGGKEREIQSYPAAWSNL